MAGDVGGMCGMEGGVGLRSESQDELPAQLESSGVETGAVARRWEAHICLMFLKNGLSLSMTKVGISPVKALSERSLRRRR